MDESPDFNLDSFNPNELSLIENIRKLATENAAIKQSLAQHNRLIETYCNDLETLRNQYIKAKQETLIHKRNVEAENQACKITLNQQSLRFDQTIGDKDLIKRILDVVCVQLDQFKHGKDDDSLKAPIQETHFSFESLQELKASLSVREKLSLDCNLSQLNQDKEDKLNQKIDKLKAELSMRMENDANIHSLESNLQDLEECNAKLESERDKLKKLVAQLQQKIEQLEFEPSVEIMEITSPQQAKVIEDLKDELRKSKEQVNSLIEENGCLMMKMCTLNEACIKLKQEVSDQQSESKGQEVWNIKETLENEISGLKDTMEQERQAHEELKKFNIDLSKTLQEQKDLQSKDLEGSAKLRQMNELLRKRESRDLDKLNSVTLQRDTFRSEYEKQLLIVKELHRKLEMMPFNRETTENISNEAAVVSPDVSDGGMSKRLDVLRRQLSSGEETIGILAEENSNLKSELMVKIDGCTCSDMSKKIDLLIEENEAMQAAFDKQKEYIKDKKEEERLNLKEIRKLKDERDALLNDIKQKQLEDGEIIQRLKEEVKAFYANRRASMEEANQYQRAFEEMRQKNDVLEATVDKAKNDYTKLWQNFQASLKKTKMMEKQLNEIEGMEEEARAKQLYLDESYMENKQLKQLLHSKERELNKVNSDLQEIEVFKTQVKIYENDFKLEREAREKQHSDISILREEVHRLQLENGRLHAEVDATQSQKVQELQRRYANSANNFPNPYYPQGGIYGRGGAPVQDNSMDYNKSSDYSSVRGSFEVPPQESDQVMQRACPKCHAPFPDLDTLQIHVLECVD